MKVEVGLEFPIERREDVIARVLALPGSLSPIHFSADESNFGKSNTIDNASKFKTFLGKAASGFFLRAEVGTYSFRIHNGYFSLDSFGLEPSEARQIVDAVGAGGCSFGYAAEPAEIHSKNRLEKHTEWGVDAGWVGRDSSLHLPGLYWLTVISDSMAARHGLDIGALAHVSASFSMIAPGVHVFELYRSPGDWKTPNKGLEDYLRSNSRIFSIDLARSEFLNAKTFLETSEVLRKWM